jgi:hypothetical protein
VANSPARPEPREALVDNLSHGKRGLGDGDRVVAGVVGPARHGGAGAFGTAQKGLARRVNQHARKGTQPRILGTRERQAVRRAQRAASDAWCGG